MPFKNSVLCKSLSLFLIVSMVFSFAGCSSDTPTPDYADFYRNFSDFDTLEPLLNNYFTGILRAYNNADPEDVFSFQLDAEAESAQTELENYMTQYKSSKYPNASKEDQEKYSIISALYSTISLNVSSFNFTLTFAQLDPNFFNTEMSSYSSFADLLASLKTKLDETYASFEKEP